MIVNITMALGNDAFRTTRDIARQLRTLAKKIESECNLSDKRIGANAFAIMDINGNQVGTFEIREDGR